MKRLNWAREAALSKLQKQGGESTHGIRSGVVENSTGAGQRALNSPSRVARVGGRAKSAYLGKVRLSIAFRKEMPSTEGLPQNLKQEIADAGGPYKWAFSHPETREKVENIRRRITKG